MKSDTLNAFYFFNTQFIHREFRELLPAFVSATSYVELFHYLLDLPLLTAALERLEYGSFFLPYSLLVYSSSQKKKKIRKTRNTSTPQPTSIEFCTIISCAMRVA